MYKFLRIYIVELKGLENFDCCSVLQYSKLLNKISLKKVIFLFKTNFLEIMWCEISSLQTSYEEIL